VLWPPRGYDEADRRIWLPGGGVWQQVGSSGGGGSLLLSRGPRLALCWGFLGRKP
jgi:hypothetical protein